MEQFFLGIAASGKPTPIALLEKPALYESSQEFYYAFRTISQGRMHSEIGPQAIQISEVLAYCDMMGIDRVDDRSVLLQLIQAMDSAYIDKSLSKSKPPPKPNHPRKPKKK